MLGTLIIVAGTICSNLDKYGIYRHPIELIQASFMLKHPAWDQKHDPGTRECLGSLHNSIIFCFVSIKTRMLILNYIMEINKFYDWPETNEIPMSAVALCHALMHVNNKAEWKQSFEEAVSTLEFKRKFRRSELFKAGNILA